jgi:alanine racemase
MIYDTKDRRCWCEVDAAALRHNVAAIRKLIAPSAGIMGLVKANAYGHGLVPAARLMAAAGCGMLGCAHVAEARLLREAGIRLPILLLSAALPEDYREIITLRLIATLSTVAEARALDRAAARLRRPVAVHVKIDTGMGRLGAPVAEADAVLEAVNGAAWLRCGGIYTHFSSADSDEAMTRLQMRRFKPFAWWHPVHHSSNSAGIFRKADPLAAWVRPGLALFGISPLPHGQEKLKPVLSWKARVTLVKRVPRGTTLSYGATFRTKRPTVVATVSAGYGDGLFRALSNKGLVLVGGRRCPILGRVTMDQILVDVTAVRGVKAGDEVVLLGRQGRERILAPEMAGWAGTIAYEVLTHITERVPRCYLNTATASTGRGRKGRV